MDAEHRKHFLEHDLKDEELFAERYLNEEI